MSELRCVKGMHDVLPGEIGRWHFLEETFRELVGRYGYDEIRTPIVEPLELFVRGIGEETDIVEKEMYAFVDKGGAKLALRPEGTASAMRSLIQHNIGSRSTCTKLYYLGPMFRRERPAKGRYRQFYQAGAELIGIEDATGDAEIIDMAVQFVSELGIDDVSVQLNSLGDGETRTIYRDSLRGHFSKKSEQLCADCGRRLQTNPLRVLDCKVESCKEIAKDAPSVLDFLSQDAKQHFDKLCGLLDEDGTPYTIVPSMVRGLDYYTKTIFEIQGTSDALGAQATIVGGGRYDGLVKELGGRQTSTIGFAFGIERLLMLLGDDAKTRTRPLVYVAAVGENGLGRARAVARKMRKRKIRVEVAYRESGLKAQLKRADKLGARFSVIAGEDEAARGTITLRNMGTGGQEEATIDDALARIEELNW